jgi:ATP-dependent RNA circularization protein (DNA/RNA ligase family)
MYELQKGELSYRVFDLWCQNLQDNNHFLSVEKLTEFAVTYGLNTVPILYEGPFSKNRLACLTSGKSTIAKHIREGVVINQLPESVHPELGRVILKSVSEEYLTRKGETTEFE